MRWHFGTGVCWDCMTPAEREKFGQQVDLAAKWAAFFNKSDPPPPS